ncbi:ribosome biogenesis GTPase YqeH [Spiroplasma tabanidicola]|uniref:30S ribosome assembly GTPase n=1 Tax=Spiroplasma tabanidicola TaxID=324079 RepID=A0A6I6C849_9MOLU|nr:ribosome biogenesis GTPase YqeH [Spiroplasma tabanidicola]QGS51926.1 30S ribosome assembly GTPase [Spiroplasma tabanidicola]
MKFSNDNSDLKDIEKQLDELEDKALLAHINGEKKINIKQKNKVTLTEMSVGLGNTTNIDNKGPKKCVGCGIEMHNTDQRKPGYVIDAEKQDYCLRCFKIKHYNSLVEQDIFDEDFVEILDEINKNKTKIRYYYVVDIFDLPGSRLEWLEKMISQKEVVVLVNKIDLLPKIVNKAKIMKYIKKFFEDSPVKDAKFILTSSIKLEYVYSLVNELKSIIYDQYIVGISNTGKSSLINACLKANQQVPSIVTSKYVNTTLNKIKINFTKNNYIYDTPGLVKQNHIAIATAPTYWDFFFFKKEIKQVTYQLLKGQTIFYGGLAWFTFEDGQEINEIKNKIIKTSYHFYVNKQMPLHRTKSENTEMYFRKNRHTLSPRLKDKDTKFEKKYFEFKDEKKYDLHISGLGWINFKAFKGLKLSITIPITQSNIKVKLLPAMI